jgi:hypothetical protein
MIELTVDNIRYIYKIFNNILGFSYKIGDLQRIEKK